MSQIQIRTFIKMLHTKRFYELLSLKRDKSALKSLDPQQSSTQSEFCIPK